jgi:hypothetical protein
MRLTIDQPTTLKPDHCEWADLGPWFQIALAALRQDALRRSVTLGYRLTVQRDSVELSGSVREGYALVTASANAGRSGVAVTEERVEVTLAWLKRLASRGRRAPTNKQIALLCLKMGTQRFQPSDRVLGIRWPKCEHGALVVRELERRGHILVERGRNWRVITLLETGQVLGRRKPRFDGSSWQRQFRGELAAA